MRVETLEYLCFNHSKKVIQRSGLRVETVNLGRWNHLSLMILAGQIIYVHIRVRVLYLSKNTNSNLSFIGYKLHKIPYFSNFEPLSIY